MRFNGPHQRTKLGFTKDETSGHVPSPQSMAQKHVCSDALKEEKHNVSETQTFWSCQSSPCHSPALWMEVFNPVEIFLRVSGSFPKELSPSPSLQTHRNRALSGPAGVLRAVSLLWGALPLKCRSPLMPSPRAVLWMPGIYAFLREMERPTAEDEWTHSLYTCDPRVLMDL